VKKLVIIQNFTLNSEKESDELFLEVLYFLHIDLYKQQRLYRDACSLLWLCWGGGVNDSVGARKFDGGS